MHIVMDALVELQKLQFGAGSDSPAVKAAMEKLRAKVPPQILGHYDRFQARGKKGLAMIRENNVCAECHMQVPLGTVITIMKGSDIQLCGSCGRYLFILDKPVEATPPVEPAAPKTKRGRKPKKKADPDVAE